MERIRQENDPKYLHIEGIQLQHPQYCNILLISTTLIWNPHTRNVQRHTSSIKFIHHSLYTTKYYRHSKLFLSLSKMNVSSNQNQTQIECKTPFTCNTKLVFQLATPSASTQTESITTLQSNTIDWIQKKSFSSIRIHNKNTNQHQNFSINTRIHNV